LSSYFGASFYDRLFDLFLSLKSELLPWVAAIIMIRVLINLVMFKSVSDMGEIIKDVFFGMLLLCFFIEIVKFSQMIPNMLHERLSSPEQMEVKFPEDRWSMWTISSYVAVGSYWVAKLVYTLFVGILIATGAFVIVAGTMLAQRYLLNLFFICLFGASLMPLFWYAINEGMKSLAQGNEQPISNFAILLVGELFKIGIPIVGAVKFFKNPFTETVKSGAGATVKGAAAVSGKTIGLFHPQSKARQFYQVMRGKDKINSVNKFPSLKKHYEHQRSKAAFNNWLHDRTPPENAKESKVAEYKPPNKDNKINNVSNQHSKSDSSQSIQNKQESKSIESKANTKASGGVNNKNVPSGDSDLKKAVPQSSTKETPPNSGKTAASKATNDKLRPKNENNSPVKNISSKDQAQYASPAKATSKKEFVTKSAQVEPFITIENKAPAATDNSKDTVNEVNL
jgi:hypothetical protein